MIIYLDGEYVDAAEAKVSVFDHGLLYGDGIFEGIRAYHGRVFKLGEHLGRLYESAKSILLDIGIPQEQMQEVVLETLRRNNLRDAYIRLVVTRGKGDLGLNPNNCSHPSIICICSNIQMYPKELYLKGMEVRTVPTRRNGAENINPRIKSLNYLNNIMAKIEANLAGMPEAILVNQEGYVAEATGDNIFIVKKGVLITPPTYMGLLEGVTRNSVMDIASEKGITVKEDVFTRHDIYIADECFLTGTAAELIPVVMVDGRLIGNGKPGALFNQLLADYRQLTEVDGPEIFPGGGN